MLETVKAIDKDCPDCGRELVTMTERSLINGVEATYLVCHGCNDKIKEVLQINTPRA